MSKDNKDEKDIIGEKTLLARERTRLANERTFSAWLRTGLSLILGGLGIIKFIDNKKIVEGYVLTLGLLFVLIGIIIYVFAFIGYRKLNKRLEGKSKELSKYYTVLAVITSSMILAGLLVMFLLIFYNH